MSIYKIQKELRLPDVEWSLKKFIFHCDYIGRRYSNRYQKKLWHYRIKRNLQYIDFFNMGK